MLAPGERPVKLGAKAFWSHSGCRAPPTAEIPMAKNRMTFEKHQRDAKKKRKAEEKRALKRKKKESKAQGEPQSIETAPHIDESTET